MLAVGELLGIAAGGQGEARRGRLEEMTAMHVGLRAEGLPEPSICRGRAELNRFLPHHDFFCPPCFVAGTGSRSSSRNLMRSANSRMVMPTWRPSGMIDLWLLVRDSTSAFL